MSKHTSWRPGTPSYVDLMAKDEAAAREFYGPLFGWEFERMHDPETGAFVYNGIDKDGHRVAGMGQMTPDMLEMGMPQFWTSYVTVTEVDAAVATAKANGAAVFMEGMDVFTAGRMAMLADPTGAAFAIWEPRDSIGAEMVNEPGAFTWNELLTADIPTAAAFYNAMFGWEADTADMGEMSYTTFRFADGGPEDALCGCTTPPMEMPSAWSVYFGVTDTDATIVAAEAAGGSVIAPAMDIPFGRIAVLSDPAGGMFSIIQMAAE